MQSMSKYSPAPMVAGGRQGGKNSGDRERLTLKELREKFIRESKMDVRVIRDWTHSPKAMTITLSGPLAAIPAIKNAKHLATSKTYENGMLKTAVRFVIDTEALAKVQAMDALFKRETGEQLVNFGEQRLWVMLVCGKRKTRFDPDNCFATVQDWLEPPEKGVSNKRKARGWGVGVTPDDKHIAGLCIRAEHLGITTEESTIIIQRWSDCGERVNAWLRSAIADAIGDSTR